MWAKEKRSAWSKVYNRERRAWYKEHGICCQCGSAPARIDRTLCEACAQAQHDKQEKCDPGRKRSQQRNIERKERRFEAGLCVNCGKRPHREGHKCCEWCAKKQRDRDMDRRVRRRLDRKIEDERNRLIEAEQARRASS